ncbi:MAG: zinc-binding dehydrogenase [Nitrospirae bacterium]|nr:zinc-binding dehydrogenase [Nitrospirota bacterium]
MKAVRFHEHGGPEVLRYEEASDPRPGPGEALVRVKACALNHLDIWIRQGIPAYTIPMPHISGCDVAGVVEAVGEGVAGRRLDSTRWKAGDRVLIAPGQGCGSCPACRSGWDNRCDAFTIYGAGTQGGYADLAVAQAQHLLPIPDGVGFEEAAAFPLTFLTAWHMLVTRAAVAPGETVLILGAGSGIGSAAVQIARLAGARVLATVGSEEKIPRAKGLGVDEVIHHGREDVGARAQALTGGRGVDVVFEHIGPATWGQSLAALAKGGRLVTCGATTGGEATVSLRAFYMRQIAVYGSLMGRRSELDLLTRLVGEGKLKPVIDSVFPLAEARQAQERMLARRQFGKIVLSP